MILKTKLVLNYLKFLLPSFLLISIYVYIKFEIASLVPHFCLVEEIINVKCPFCNLTKAFLFLINGEYKLALVHNMLSFFLPIYLIQFQVYKYFKLYKKILRIDFYFTLIIILQFIISNYQFDKL
jgi:hypothetical protein